MFETFLCCRIAVTTFLSAYWQLVNWYHIFEHGLRYVFALPTLPVPFGWGGMFWRWSMTSASCNIYIVYIEVVSACDMLIFIL